MSDNPWIDAVPAWVSLATLLSTVERELRIPRNQAAKPLRQALETLEIDTAIIDWRDLRASPQSNAGRWTTRALSDSPGSRAVAHEGWIHVDWDAGALAGCDIKVRWDQVVRTLAAIEDDGRIGAQVQPVRLAGGRPTKHDWDAFWIEVGLFASKHDLFEVDRTKMQRHMEQWSADHMSDPTPDPATVRAKIKMLYEAVERAKNSAG